MKNISFTHLTYLFFGIGLFVFSCKKDVDFEPTEDTTAQEIAEHVTFLEETPEADARMVIVNEAVVLNDTTLERSACQKYGAWSRVADVTTLTHSSGNLSTTHIAISGDLALVSYHKRGSVNYGAVEVIDLKDPNSPKIRSQAFFSNADVNSIAVEQNPSGNTTKVWVALGDNKNGAMLGELSLKNKKFENNYYRTVKLAYELEGTTISSNANDITEAGDYLYVTAGRSNGGVLVLNKADLSVAGYKQFANAKGVAVNGGVANEATVAAIQTDGTPGIHTDLVGSFSFNNFFPIDAITHQNVEDPQGGKTTAAFTGEGSPYLMTTSGKNGVKGYDISNGQLVFSSPEKMIEFGNANGLTIDDQFMYVACGAEGLAIFPLLQNGLPDEESTFIWDLEEPEASANYVAARNGWVFVAKGEGGFKILKKPSPGDCLSVCAYDNDGVPACLSNNVTVCSSLPARLEAAMPLGVELEGLHPEYFTSGSSEIKLIEDATLKLTFVEENTSLESSLGYYFYHEECPPESAEELIGMVSFVNFSAKNSGGELEPGHTVKLPGKFKAGTRIGFFFLRNGWNGGHQIYYSNHEFHSNKNYQGLLFYDAECGDIIGAFQGNPTPSNDADFRDMIFKVTLSSPTAIDEHDYLSL